MYSMAFRKSCVGTSFYNAQDLRNFLSIFRSLMNCVNSISQMNPSSCEHSSLIPQDPKKFGPSGPGGPTPGSSEKDEGFEGKQFV